MADQVTMKTQHNSAILETTIRLIGHRFCLPSVSWDSSVFLWLNSTSCHHLRRQISAWILAVPFNSLARGSEVALLSLCGCVIQWGWPGMLGWWHPCPAPCFLTRLSALTTSDVFISGGVTSLPYCERMRNCGLDYGIQLYDSFVQ